VISILCKHHRLITLRSHIVTRPISIPWIVESVCSNKLKNCISRKWTSRATTHSSNRFGRSNGFYRGFRKGSNPIGKEEDTKTKMVCMYVCMCVCVYVCVLNNEKKRKRKRYFSLFIGCFLFLSRK
jgi:hypothetical protein